MKKEEFLKFIQHYTSSSAEEAQEIVTLKKTFPYSQLLHVLSARVSKDHTFADRDAELQLAAVYSADRSILKQVMQEPSKPWPASIEITGQHHPEAPHSIYSPDKQSSDTKTDVASEVMHDLEILHELKHNFETMFMGTEVIISKKTITPDAAPIPLAGHSPVTQPVVQPKKEYKEDAETTLPEATPKKQSSSKTKAQRIVELAKGLQAAEESDAPVQKKAWKSSNPGDSIIDEIVNSKKKITPESKKQQEQIELIDQFIKVQPSISGPKSANAPQGDLSTIKSGEFGDNVISETLVDILLKQGKKDKAIEVLKKLIWKFPQKKAYFAAQIEELKK